MSLSAMWRVIRFWNTVVAESRRKILTQGRAGYLFEAAVESGTKTGELRIGDGFEAPVFLGTSYWLPVQRWRKPDRPIARFVIAVAGFSMLIVLSRTPGSRLQGVVCGANHLRAGLGFRHNFRPPTTDERLGDRLPSPTLSAQSSLSFLPRACLSRPMDWLPGITGTQELTYAQ